MTERQRRRLSQIGRDFARRQQRLADESGTTMTISTVIDGQKRELVRFEPKGGTMAEGTTTEPNGRTRKAKLPDGLDRAREAMAQALDEQWERFVAAIDETEGDEGASCSVSIKYQPGNEQRPAAIIVQGKAALPTSRTVFRAARDGGQLALLLEGE